MSFSESRSKYAGVGPASGVSGFEKAYLACPAHVAIDEDQAIELLVDEIRTVLCDFQFKEPLGDAFEMARDSALNCLEMGEPPPRKVRDWVSNFLKCGDCILLVYVRDVLKERIAQQGRWPKERDVYTAYEGQEDSGLKRVGAIHHAVYQARSNLEHFQVVTKDGRRDIRPVRRSRTVERYQFVRRYLKESLDIMVPRFRDAFPDACTDRG